MDDSPFRSPISILIVESDPFVSMDIAAALTNVWPAITLHHAANPAAARALLEDVDHLHLAVLDAPFEAIGIAGIVPVIHALKAGVLFLSAPENAAALDHEVISRNLEKPFSEDGLVAAILQLAERVGA